MIRQVLFTSEHWAQEKQNYFPFLFGYRKEIFGPLAIRLAKTMIFLSVSESGRYGLIKVNYSMVKSGFTPRICL